jgi:hypothetical protein
MRAPPLGEQEGERAAGWVLAGGGAGHGGGNFF